MKKDTKILVCTHKAFEFFGHETFLPVQVGAALNKKLPYQPDDQGENISLKNKTYCELTGLYWAWKNLQVEYLGLCHYRRFFNFKIKNNNQITESYLIDNKNDFIFNESFFGGADIILPKHKRYAESIGLFYRRSHIPEDLDVLRTVVKEHFSTYLTAFDKVMDGNTLYPYNMFICKKTVADDYMAWLFRVLEIVEQKIQISHYPYQSRVLGFMSERLLNVYVEKNKLKIKEVPVSFVTTDPVSESPVKELIKDGIKNLLFRVSGKIHPKTEN